MTARSQHDMLTDLEVLRWGARGLMLISIGTGAALLLLAAAHSIIELRAETRRIGERVTRLEGIEEDLLTAVDDELARRRRRSGHR